MLNLFKSVFGTPEKKASKYDDEIIDWATEKLVDGTDTRLRLVSGYKRKLRDCVERSLGHLVSVKQRTAELEKQRTLLRSKLRTLESGQLGMEPFASAKPTQPGDAASLEVRLREIEAELGKTEVGVKTLDEYLSHVIEVMSNPEDHLRVTPASVRVTQMGFVVTDEFDEQGDEVEYTKVEAVNLGVFAVRLVTFPVNALLPPEQFRPRI